jgi:hypothetical protein
LEDEHFEDKCTNVLWSVWIYTTRSSNIKNSASTFWASSKSSKEACASNHEVGTGTSYAKGHKKRIINLINPEKPSSAPARNIKQAKLLEKALMQGFRNKHALTLKIPLQRHSLKHQFPADLLHQKK